MIPRKSKFLSKYFRVIKYPEITKKISTPIKPPPENSGNMWNTQTLRMAKALNPSISGLYIKFEPMIEYNGKEIA
jgi:hypothetical protein